MAVAKRAFPSPLAAHKGQSVLDLKFEVCGRRGGVAPCRLEGGP